MYAEDLKEWPREDMQEKKPVQRRWHLLVRLIQRAFGYSNLLEEVTWDTMVSLLKGKGGYQGIGIMEVIWNLFLVVVNCRLKRSMEIHDS